MTIDETLHKQLLKERSFGVYDGFVAAPNNVFMLLGEDKIRIGADKIIDDDVRLDWVHSLKWIRCHEFLNTQVPIGSSRIDITEPATDGERLGIWNDALNNNGRKLLVLRLVMHQISSRCTMSVVRKETEEPRIQFKLESTPGEIGLFQIDYNNADVRYSDYEFDWGEMSPSHFGKSTMIFNGEFAEFLRWSEITMHGDFGDTAGYIGLSLSSPRKEVDWYRIKRIENILGIKEHCDKCLATAHLRVDENWKIVVDRCILQAAKWN